MALTLLPRFFVMQATSGGPYLGVQKSVPASLPSGFLKFNEPQIWSPRVKFATEKSEDGDDNTLVHIRSCYNNKYWVVRTIQGKPFIVASADKPQEDLTNPECTLFRAQPGQQGGFHLVSAGMPSSAASASLWEASTDTQYGIIISGSSSNFHAVDWETLVILPSKVSFKSEELNGYYLASRVIEGWPYHRFESGLGVGNDVVANELHPTADGNYRIKDLHFGKFWRRSPNWIWANASDDDYSKDALFSFVRVSDSVVALRNLANNNFCGPLTTEGKTNCLNAWLPTISKEARLMVQESVLERIISDVEYRLSDSRIYREEIQEVSHAFATNNDKTSDNTIALSFSITDSRTTSWNNSVSVSVGVVVGLEVQFVPLVVTGKIELSTQVGYTHEWGVSQTTEIKREATYNVVVPPLTTMKVTLMCTKGACDVPFSYTERDLLPNGTRVSTRKDDGIYKGINSYNFYFESSKVVDGGDSTDIVNPTRVYITL